jgi:hypothetical protein
MKERPILFSAEMVRALLEGRKTQTRRALTRQFLDVLPLTDKSGWIGLIERETAETQSKGEAFRCKFGVPGDELWVKETWRVSNRWDAIKPSALPFSGGMTIMYAAGGSRAHDANHVYVNDDSYPETLPTWAAKTRVSIHMPRAASRIQLRITEVRCERLQEISEADATAEGVEPAQCCHAHYHGYRLLWEKINGAGSWEMNPFVWAISFERVRP